jgi:hypothetical protein
VVNTGAGQLRRSLADLALVAGWSPFGWVWAIPADVSRSAWGATGIHLILAIALACLLWMAWRHFLARGLVSPIEGGGTASKVRDSTAIERLYPATPAGGVAGRTLRYWRRDPRYLAGIAGFLIGPIVLIITHVINSVQCPLAVFAPSLWGCWWDSALLRTSVRRNRALAAYFHRDPWCRGSHRAGDVDHHNDLPAVDGDLALRRHDHYGEWHLLVPAVGLAPAPQADGPRRRLWSVRSGSGRRRRQEPTRSPAATPAACPPYCPSPSPCSAP